MPASVRYASLALGAGLAAGTIFKGREDEIVRHATAPTGMV